MQQIEEVYLLERQRGLSPEESKQTNKQNKTKEINYIKLNINKQQTQTQSI